jgi:hypothetical protein
MILVLLRKTYFLSKDPTTYPCARQVKLPPASPDLSKTETRAGQFFWFILFEREAIVSF